MTPTPQTDQPHQHQWQPNGTVEVDRVEHSPISRWGDFLWTDVLAVQSCSCGEVRQVRVGWKNERSRGDDLRKEAGA